jgi:hypothetical protein
MLGFKKLKVIKDFSTDVITHMISEDEPNMENELFQVGAVLEVDIIEEDEDVYREIQFGDGSVAYHLPKKMFLIIT